MVADTADCTCAMAVRPRVEARKEFASLYVTWSCAAVGSSPPAEAMSAEKSAGIVTAK
jgi:hypothetical protein